MHLIDEVTQYAIDVLEGVEIAGPYVRAACRRHMRDLDRSDIWFDHAEYDRVVNKFFQGRLKLSEGQFEGEPFNLHASQKFIVGSMFCWKRPDGTRRFRRAYVEQGKGNGKALAVDTPIPTPSGWATMGDLRPGDRVFDERGAVCRVLAVSGHMRDRPCYRIRFSDGAEVVADAGHLWSTAAMRGSPKGGYAVRTTEEIARTVAVTGSKSRHPQAKWNHRVDVAGALEMPDADLIVPPYVLGAWLGDGDSDCARLTVAYADWQIVEEIEREGVGCREQNKHSATTARVIMGSPGRGGANADKLQAKLRALGVLGKKFIPPEYLRASAAQRLALLQGLMDTDGSVAKGGQCELTTVSSGLADDAVELIASLGFKPTRTVSEAKLNGRVVNHRHRIQFWSYCDRPVFRLARKVSRLRETPATRPISAGRMIVACDPVPSVPVQCISVDSPSQMFLCGRRMVPTHNSPLVGGIGLFGMMFDNEPGAQIYSAGATRDQSDILFQDAVKMAKAAPKIDADVTYSGNAKIWNMAALGPRQRGSFFRPLARTAGKHGSGVRPHFALCDELHEHPSADVLDLLERGFKFRRNPMLIMITNSGSDRKSVCWHEREHAVKVVKGDAEDDSTFSYVCAMDEGDDPLEDPSCWKKANPLLGVTITEEYLAGVVSQARSMPTKRNNVLRLHFCVWTDAETAWIRREDWEACEDPDMTLEEFEGVSCRAGLDLASRKDIAAKVLAFDDGYVEVPGKDGEMQVKPKLAIFAHGYTPAKTLRAREREDRAPYSTWVDGGFLTATEGPVVRFEFIVHDLVQDAERFDLQLVAFDRYLISKFEETCSEMGAELPLIEHPQGFNKRKDTPLWMPGSIQELEEMILERRVRIHVNPALRSAAAGATFVTSPAALNRFAKDKATQRIDLIVAAAMAVGASVIRVEGEEESVYEALARERQARQKISAGELQRVRLAFARGEISADEFDAETAKLGRDAPAPARYASLYDEDEDEDDGL